MPEPSAVDARLRRDGVSLRAVRRVIPKEIRRPSALRSWATLARIGASGALCLWLLSQVEITSGWRLLIEVPLLLALWLAYGWVLVGLFVVGHECGHYAFSRRRWVNHLVGHLCLSPLFNSFHTWRLTHDHHHAHTLLRGQEVDWSANLATRDELASLSWRKAALTRLGYALPFGILVWIYANSARRALGARSMIPAKRRERALRQLALSNAVLWLTLIAIYGGLFAHLGLWGLIKYHGAPATIAMMTGAFLIAIQHAHSSSILYTANAWSPVKGQLVSTFDVRFPRLLEWLWCKINIHVPHHVLPGVPWYHLQRASDAIREAFPDYHQEYRFRLRDLAWMARTPLLEESRGGGYFVLTPSGSGPSVARAAR